MNILVDANLPPRVAKVLSEAGYTAVHVGDVGLLSAPDHVILRHAASNDQVILSSDTDFGTLLAPANASTPSFVLLRHTNELTMDEIIRLLIDNLPTVVKDLQSGAIVTITTDRMRIRQLPIRP